MQDISSTERFDDFERAVIEAAEVEAKALILGAQKERDDMLYKAEHSVAKSEYEKLMQKAEQWRFKLKATLNQEIRRRLLVYREELINTTITQLREKLCAFAKSEDYKTLNKTKLEKYTFTNETVLFCKPGEEDIFKALCKNVSVNPSAEIELGGFLLQQGKLMYDESVDTALAEEEKQMLSYCGLEVV